CRANRAFPHPATAALAGTVFESRWRRKEGLMRLRTIVAINSLAVFAVAPHVFAMGDIGTRTADRGCGTASFTASFSGDQNQATVTDGSQSGNFQRIDSNVDPRMRSTGLFAAAFNPATNQLSISNGSTSGTFQLTDTNNRSAVSTGGPAMFASFT